MFNYCYAYTSLSAYLKDIQQEGGCYEIPMHEALIDEIQCLKERVVVSPLFLLTLHFSPKQISLSKMISNMKELSPSWIDIDVRLYYEARKELEDWPSDRLILSYHQRDLEEIDFIDWIRSISSYHKGLYKFVTVAKSVSHCLKQLAFYQNYCVLGQPGIYLCMGVYGQLSRLLSSTLGAPWTYIPAIDQQLTAPGQLSHNELKEIYKISSRQVNGQFLALIGSILDYSPSHITHNRVLELLDQPYVYVKIPLSQEELSQSIESLRLLPLKGLSITMPFKEKILEYLDERDASVLFARSCNTVVVESGVWKGYNTDGTGAFMALGCPRKHRICILGSGGTAKAIAWKMIQEENEVIICGRNLEELHKIRQYLGCSIALLTDICDIEYDILVQATCVGMLDHATLLHDYQFLPGKLVLDVVNKSEVTTFLLEAQKAGCSVVSGKEMFAYQAIEQFCLWLNLSWEDQQKVAQTLFNSLGVDSLRGRRFGTD